MKVVAIVMVVLLALFALGILVGTFLRRRVEKLSKPEDEE